MKSSMQLFECFASFGRKFTVAEFAQISWHSSFNSYCKRYIFMTYLCGHCGKLLRSYLAGQNFHFKKWILGITKVANTTSDPLFVLGICVFELLENTLKGVKVENTNLNSVLNRLRPCRIPARKSEMVGEKPRRCTRQGAGGML